MAWQYGAELTLPHVLGYFQGDRSSVAIAPEGADPAACRKQQEYASLSGLARHLGNDEAGQEVRVPARSARHEVVRFTEEQAIDLKSPIGDQ